MIAASVSAMAATGAAAFEATATVDITIDGILAGDRVSFYKLGTPSVDEHNEMTITWTDGAIATMLDGKETEAWDFATNAPIQKALAGLIANGTITLGDADFTSNAATGTSVTTAVAPGYYLALVRQGDASGADGAKIIYQNMLINAIPVPNASTGVWETHAAITADVKKTEETLTKTQQNKGSEEWVATTIDGYKFGEYIPFKITTNIPSYPEDSKVATFEITDEPTGLRIVENDTYPVTVTINDTEVDADDDTFTVTVEDGNLSIVFAKAYILENPNAAVEVTYSAELLGNDNEIEVDETNNSAKIKYNNNPDEETYQEPGTTIKQKTYNFTLKKYDEADAERNPLVGASFTLWTAEEGGTQISLKADTTTDGTAVYRPIKDGEQADEYIVATDGTATIVGLAGTEYWVQEDIAPAGYTKLAGRQNVTASATTSTVGVDTEVPNTKGSTLPETGGMGTTVLYIAGSVLVLAAAILLVTKRRMGAEE